MIMLHILSRTVLVLNIDYANNNELLLERNSFISNQIGLAFAVCWLINVSTLVSISNLIFQYVVFFVSIQYGYIELQYTA